MFSIGSIFSIGGLGLYLRQNRRQPARDAERKQDQDAPGEELLYHVAVHLPRLSTKEGAREVGEAPWVVPRAKSGTERRRGVGRGDHGKWKGRFMVHSRRGVLTAADPRNAPTATDAENGATTSQCISTSPPA